MSELKDRKLYLGPRLRVLRRELGVNQTQMAEELGVSASYLNHLERNQRPLTAQMLLRLANTYDIDVRDFVSGAGKAAASDLSEAFADTLVRDIGVQRHEISELAENHPAVAEVVSRFHRALSDLRKVPDAIDQLGVRTASPPLDWVRELLQQRRHHFPELDAAAEALAAELPDEPEAIFAALRSHLAERRISVHFVPQEALGWAVRDYDYHRRRLRILDRLPFASRLFALAYQAAVVSLEAVAAEIVERAAPPDQDARALLRVAVANYAAAAILMPYDRFRAVAEESRFDLPLLTARFGCSFEQVAHRLTTLDRQGARGIPFFMVKVDSAGQVSKRVSGEDYPFARHGGICPRWTIHKALRAPGEIVAQTVEAPDGKQFLILARAAPPSEGKSGGIVPQVVGIGCELRHAGRIAHADALTAVAPTAIGPGCHVCERVNCPDRALPPVTRSLDMHQHRRFASPYPFRRA